MRTSSVEQLILDLLAGHSTCEAHFTAQEVYAQLKPRLPAVNPSTIYRALERLVHAGKVSVSDMGAGAAVYEVVGLERHHHLVCQDCGQVHTIGDEAVSRLFSQLEQENHFQIVTNHLILFGRCARCQKQQSRN